MLTKLVSGLDWRHWVLSHAVWIVAITVALIFGHSYIAEHDARVLADAQVKTSEAHVVDLTKQIAQTDAAAAQKVQIITRIVHDVVTPAQAVAVIPQVTDTPLNARVATDNPAQISVDAIPLVTVLGQCKVDKVNLDACQSDLKNETTIVGEKNGEIVALKKKPNLLHRFGSVMKAVGVGVGIGLLLAGHV